jgi:superfamily I DNA and/or RNA helicase
LCPTQGAEKDIILLATTTTNPNSEFCSDGARINVAITRARHHLVVVGMADVLAQVWVLLLPCDELHVPEYSHPTTMQT